MFHNSCVLSSFVFITNAIVAIYVSEYIYGALFAGLFITSILFHTHTNIYTNLLDKCFVISVILYGGYLLYQKVLQTNHVIQMILITGICLTFLTTIYLFGFGYIFKQYCFCDNNAQANLWHSYLHLVSSIGHHLILFL